MGSCDQDSYHLKVNSTTRVLDQLRDLLIAREISFREVNHQATSTSEESARARGEELRVGGKALLIKMNDTFRLIVLPADRRLDSAQVKREFQVKKIRFASQEELWEQTGLVPGSVPPFGYPILPFELFADEALRANDRIAFNAGSLTTSFILAMDDYVRIANPTFMNLSQQ